MNKYIRTLKYMIAQGYHPASAVECIVAAFALSRDEARQLVQATKQLAA